MAGSVDDGKSTLVGRLLYDCGGAYEDQMEAVTNASRDSLDLALLTDGLRSEREQGITIDVAYRYFATRNRKFILADTPGHEQYTRNMATGASSAQVAVILVDARKGILPQTVRHGYLAWLLGIRTIVVAVNKMDLVEFRQEIFVDIQHQLRPLADKLKGTRFYCVPVVATEGDNVARKSDRIEWFRGPSILEYLESVSVEIPDRSQPFRFPVQLVLRTQSLRTYAGQIASGVIAVGDDVLVLPSGKHSRIKCIPSFGTDHLKNASSPASVALGLEDELDVGRGDMLVSPEHPPVSARAVRANLVWMSESPSVISHPYLIKHAAQTVCAAIVEIVSVFNVHEISIELAGQLSLNDIGTVELEVLRPIFCDPYSQNRSTGSFVLIDPITNLTVAAGMIISAVLPRSVEPQINGKHGLAVWLTGLSSAGKTTLANEVFEYLWSRGHQVEILDGDDVRRNLSRGLGFNKEDRDENIRRIGFVAKLLARNGVITIVSAISPYRSTREEVRSRIINFLEVYVNAPLEVCEKRDVKGLYQRARSRELNSLTGVDDPYEPPLSPDVECHTNLETIKESAAKIIGAIENKLRSPSPL